jgi:hypothetical protein
MNKRKARKEGRKKASKGEKKTGKREEWIEEIHQKKKTS